MKSCFVCASLAVLLLGLPLSASARDTLLPAGTLLQCTITEPNFSPATAAVGDPVLCHLRGVTEFGQPAFPRGAYLVGHLESAHNPGHFWGKGDLKLQFDRIGLPNGDLPLDAKIIATRGYKVDKEGDIHGKGHAKRDVVEWMLPPLWPEKVIMLPARGPKPTLKGEAIITLRLMDDVQLPQVGRGPEWHYFGELHGEAYQDSQLTPASPQLMPRPASSEQLAAPKLSYASMTTRQTVPNASLAAVNVGTASPGMPVFVLKTGMVLSLGNYSYQDGRITYTLAGGGGGVISTDDIDWSATTRVNTQRGVRLSLHGGHLIQDAPGL